MAKYDADMIFNASHAARVTQAEHEDTENLIAAFILEKNRNFDLMDEKKQAAKLRATPDYLSTIGMNEPTQFGAQQTTLREMFIEMARTAKLQKIRRINGHEVVYHTCFADSLAQAAQAWLDAKPGERDGWRYPRYGVFGQGNEAVFVEMSLATKKVEGAKSLNPQAIIARAKAAGLMPAKSPVIVGKEGGATKNLHQQELDSQDKENAKLLEKIAKLQAENAALSERKVTSHAPLSQASEASPVSEAPPVGATIN